MSVAVATLRLRSAEADTPALRLRAARELQAADLTPAGLPPAAVLVVRRLVDPMPGRFGCGRVRPRSDWERAVRDALATAARTAARVDARGRLPASAAAVIFADEAELLACLLADRARGDVDARWWWRALVRRLGVPARVVMDSGRDVAPILAARSRETPAALTILTRWGEAAHVASTMSSTAAASALTVLARTHALPLDLVTRPGVASLEEARVERPAHTRDGVLRTPQAPWSAWLPPALGASTLAPEVRCLFGVALGLAAAPSQLRSSAATADARRWWRAVVGEAVAAQDVERSILRDTSTSPNESASDSDRAASSRATPESIGAIDGRATSSAIDAPASRVHATTPRERLLNLSSTPAPDVPRPVDAQSEATPDRSAHAQLVEPSEPPGATSDVSAINGHAVPDEHTRLDGKASCHGSAARPVRPNRSIAARTEQPSVPVSPSLAGSAEREDVLSALAGDGVVTDVGGVLYLIHALEDLSLPDAFEPGWHAASLAGPWGALDLIGRALLGRRFARVAQDPLWRTLALLAAWEERKVGRRVKDVLSTGLPGRATDPVYRVPPDWLARLDDRAAQFVWAVRGGRLWLWSEQGYLVSHRRDRRADHHAAERALARVVSPDQPAPTIVRGRAADIPWSPPAALPVACPPRLGRWAAAVAPVVRRRLLLALGLDGRADAAAIADRLAVRARLCVTSSHVDVVMTLDRADLSVRRSGLDRDPGWLPAYGRVISFHFK